MREYNSEQERVKRRKKSKKFTYKMQSALMAVYGIVIAAMIGLVIRIVYINVNDGDRYKKAALSQQTYTSAVIPFKRGDITDRNGTVLATSVKEYNLCVDPEFLLSKNDKGEYLYKNDTLDVLCEYFGFKLEELEKIIEENKSKRYLVLKKNVSVSEKEGYEEFLNEYTKKRKEEKKSASVKGVIFEGEYVRKYPLSTVGSTVVGFTYDKNLGNWGIEGYYNDSLNGTIGKEFGYFDSELNLESTIIDPVDGNTVVSTVDINVQRIVEENILKFEEKMGGKTVAVLMTDPQTGEIIAMANSNGIYDLNDPKDVEKYFTDEEVEAATEKLLLDYAIKEELCTKDNPPANVYELYDDKRIKAVREEAKIVCLNSMWKNFCVTDTYEPGSTFKPFVVASGLESGKLNGNEAYTCKGALTIGGRPIRCAKRTGHGTLDLEQGIMMSCNVVLMHVGNQLGKTTFLDYQNRFGFGGKTGVDVQGAAIGLVFKEEQVGPQELATSSFGQGINVTMMQMAAGFGSLINGGNYYEPHVVKQILNDKGAVVEDIEKNLVKQTVTSKTSATMRKALYNTVLDGTAKSAQVDGYVIGGKTGTAQKLPRGNGKYLVSFLGFAAVDDVAKVICYVIVDEPNTDDQAHSTFAQELFSDIMADALPFLGVYPQSDVHAPYYGEEEDVTTPDGEETDGDVTENATDSNGEDVIPPETFVDDSDYDYEAIPDENDSGDEETEGESEESQTDEIAENE